MSICTKNSPTGSSSRTGHGSSRTRSIHDWRCVIFRTSPLPHGRGGSPIQNQIARGVYESDVCAVKAVANVDAGPVYLRRRIDLSKGSVEEILIQVSEIVFGMIPVIVRQNVAPVEQDGEPVTFRRRKPQESQMPREPKGPREVYDHIRMLVGEGYPRRTSSTAGTA